MRDPSEFLPLKPVDFHVLVAVLSRDRHGYGIVTEIEQRTEGKIRLVPGNLYPVLRRLVGAALLEEEVESPPGDAKHKQRRYYAITPLGRRVAAAEATRLRSLVSGRDIRELIERGAEGTGT